MTPLPAADFVTLDCNSPLWEHFFMVSPLVLIGTRDADGETDFAPKHMVSPMGWDNYFGFVCTPRHGTYANIRRSGVFSVSFPRPSQLVLASLTATPRCSDQHKPLLQAIPSFPAEHIEADLFEHAYLYFECELHKIYDDFGINSLITGRIIAASVDREAMRVSSDDDDELIHHAPQLAYLHPGRFAVIERSNAFPFPKDMKK